MLPARTTCPAALRIAGVSPGRAGIVCRVIQQDRQKADGIGVDPGQLAQQRVGGDGDTFLTIEKDPSTVENLCCGDALPVLDEREVPGNRASYTYCPVWQAERWREEQGQERLGRQIEPDRTSYDFETDDELPGAVTTLEADDPWAQARADLELFDEG